MASYGVRYLHECDACGAQVLTFPLCVACSLAVAPHTEEIEPIRRQATRRVKFHRKPNKP